MTAIETIVHGSRNSEAKILPDKGSQQSFAIQKSQVFSSIAVYSRKDQNLIIRY